MSKMKHLLRKLHIGGSSGVGGGGGGFSDHHRLDESSSTRPMIDPSPIPSSSPSPASTSSVSSSGFGNASTTMPRLETFEPVGRDLATVDGVDFNLMEEEYQVQLAMAISVSDPDPRENADTAQPDAAKRISFGVSAPVTDADSAVDFLSLRYWGHKVINYDQKVRDGFYDVYGITSNSLSQGKMPLLVDLQAISISDNVGYEVILVNRLIDPDLQELERRATALSLECPDFVRGQVSSDLTQKIANIVVEQMGGPVENADEALRRWMLRSYELRNSLNTTILPLGRVNVGLARHRALLFKVLADRINLPCMLVKGSYYTGTDDGAVNLIRLDDKSEYIIDLMGAPGALIPAEVPSSFLPVSCTDTRVFPEDLDTLQHSCPVLEKQIETPASSVLGETDSRFGIANFFAGNHEENRYAVEKHQTERFEHDFGKLMQSQQISGENLPPFSGKPTCAQKVKVKNVSKYVISAAKNPEFAQKLHAVLLESGASPPPDLFTDVNTQNLREKNMLQEFRQDSSRSMSSGAPCYPEKVADSLAEQLRETEKNPTALQPSALCTSAETYQQPGEVDLSMKRNFDLDKIGKVSSSGKMEIGSANGEHAACDSHGEGINPFLGEAAKWEIMWEDLQIGERIGIGSYGEVYRAEWNGTEVAVKKFLDQDFSGDALTQFKSEIEIMLRLWHPNVVLFMGAVTRPPNFSILTEFLPSKKIPRKSMLNQKPSFRFEINNFSEKESVIASETFVSGGCEWLLMVYPKGENFLPGNHLSLYLRVANPNSLQTGCKKRVQYYFVVLNQSNKELLRSSPKAGRASTLFCSEEWGFHSFLSKFEEKGFLENDKLIIEVYINVLEDNDVSKKKETVDINGFQVLASQLTSVKKLCAEHPNVAEDFNKAVKTAYMNVLLNLVKKLEKSSETKLSKDVGFKLKWMESKLDEISLEKKIFNEISLEKKKLDGESRVGKIKEHLKNLEVMELDSKVAFLETKLNEITLEMTKDDDEDDEDESWGDQLEERVENLEAMELGYKIESLKTELDEVSSERTKENSRAEELEKRLKNLEVMELGSKVEYLETKLNEVTLEMNKEENDDESWGDQLEERVNYLEEMELGSKIESLKTKFDEISWEMKKSNDANRVKNLKVMELEHKVDFLNTKLEEVCLEKKNYEYSVDGFLLVD